VIGEKIMKKLLVIILPLLLIVGCSNVEGQQQLIPDIKGKYENGNIKSITYHKKTRNGIEKIKEEIYHENGQKEGEGTFKDGKREGKWSGWYENGQKEGEGTFKDGKLEGLVTGWYENGQKNSEQLFKDGNLISLKEWNEDGSDKE